MALVTCFWQVTFPLFIEQKTVSKKDSLLLYFKENLVMDLQRN